MAQTPVVPGASTLVPPATPQRIMLGGVTLAISPQGVTEKLPRQVVYLPAMLGAIRTDFGNGPREWTIQGHTGQGGLSALLQLRGLEAKAGKAQRAVSFLYPWKYGTHVFKVYVDDTQWDETVSGGAYTFSYTLQLREVSPLSSQPPIVKVAAIPTTGGGVP
jgi:hypothetical protein